MTALVVVGAFGLGVAVGWATGLIPGLVRAEPSASPSPTPVPSIIATVEPVLPVMAPITRQLTQGDRDAGVTTTDIKLKAAGTISVVPGIGAEQAGAGETRWVSVAVEDGVQADASAFKAYVIATLNANRGWGSGHSVQFVPTDGVADYRIVLASPYTAEVLCPDPHLTKPAGSFIAATPHPSPTPTPGPTPSPQSTSNASPSPDPADSPWSCGQEGVIVLSSYDWTAGFSAFGTDFAGARTYMLNHHVGHLLGHDDVDCTGVRADIMVSQEGQLPEGCEANPWPYPDAPVEFGRVDPSPSASAAAHTP